MATGLPSRGRARESGTARRLADVVLAAFVLLVVAMMVVPLPTVLLDVLIAGNVSVAVLMLLVALYVASGLEFTAFPTVLLVTTLYRLALNVSSTRLILLQADAGEVIRAFGEFVVRGNYVVGAVVFAILTLVQFLVIAKGSERVAEVGARFTLDAMPGKQMSIDAELRSGAIGQDEARRKRALVQRESQFYGAMDGAMKFVKGDAIAGIVITLANVLGGLAIGITLRDMSATEALETYGLLTIGDGLVSQIPALLISTSAGLVVTRVVSEEEGGSLGADVAAQIFGDPRTLSVAAAFLVVLAAVPGLPALPFGVLALVFFTLSRRLARRPAEREVGEAVARQEVAREHEARRAMVPLVVPVSVEVGDGLAVEVADAGGAGPLLEREVPPLRDALFLDLGVALPGLRARANPQLAPREARIALQEVPALSLTLPEGRHLALAAADELPSLGVEAGTAATDPDDGGPAAWVRPEDTEALGAAGIPVLDAAAVVARALGAAVRRRASSLLGLQETQAMLDQLERAYPARVRHVVPKPVSLALLADVLRRLVDEGVSVRPLREILEALAVHAPSERDPVALTEHVRAGLKRQITHRFAEGGALDVFLVDPAIEDAIRDGVQRTATGSYLALAPDLSRELIGAVKAEAEHALPGLPFVLVTQADVRRFLRRLVEVDVPDAVVLSFQELAPDVRMQPLGRIRPEA